MKKNNNLEWQLNLMLDKAQRSIANSKVQISLGDYDFASSRAYYGSFYAISAILLTKQITFSKHSAVLSAFNQYFIKTEIFPKDTSKLITRLFRERHTGDYVYEKSISKEDASEDVRIAEIIVNKIKVYLKENNFINSQPIKKSY